MTETPRKHLWENDHPYYGPDDNTNECESFASLRAQVDGLDEGMNHIYRWDWRDWSQPQYASTVMGGEEPEPADFVVYLVLPRKSLLINFTCPISHDQEPEVLEWLASDRVSGAMRRLWEPVTFTEDGPDAR
jgi:hypothetical protein